MAEGKELFRIGVKAVQAILRCHPKVAIPVFQQGIDVVVAEAGRIVLDVGIGIKMVAVEAVQAVLGADPKKALAVL